MKASIDNETLAARLAMLVKLTTERCIDEGGIATALGVYDAVTGAVERSMLRTVLDRVHGNQSHAARVLGINRNTLRKKMRLHGMLK